MEIGAKVDEIGGVCCLLISWRDAVAQAEIPRKWSMGRGIRWSRLFCLLAKEVVSE